MRRWVLALFALSIAGLAGFWFLTAPQPVIARADTSLETGGDAQRGKIVFLAGGCASCHVTSGQENTLLLGGGHAFPSPFGTFYAPNISPDPENGIGKWTTADLVNALKAGVSPKGSHYYPAFPYTTYAKMTNTDARDLMSYLKTLPPVAIASRPHDLPFPFNIRRGLGLWKRLYLDRAPIAADPAKSPGWNRGQYLVEALGHCAECHSPRNFIGGIVASQRFAGGPNPDGKGWVPNMTQSKKGIGEWSTSDIALMLESGLTASMDSVGSSMADVIKNTSKLSKEDRAAMAEYIKTIPAREGPARPGK
ncbi:MAG: cytochrome c [Beijerinckiaceae bacterium]|jgi:mono/diheme cytochrome c family protein|nr:cytochrome c [Beijerinckiaceae bacterium]